MTKDGLDDACFDFFFSFLYFTFVASPSEVEKLSEKVILTPQLSLNCQQSVEVIHF